MKDPSQVRVTGPLGLYAKGFRAELARQGYASSSAVNQLKLVGHLSRWMTMEGLSAAELVPAVIERYVAARRAACYRHNLSEQGLRPLLGYLRGLGALAGPAPPGPASPHERLLEDYAGYLVAERSLAPGTVRYYLRFARLFVSSVPEETGPGLGAITTGDVSRFVVEQCGRRSVGSARTLVMALRSLLRFLHVTGLSATPLAGAVPAVAPWRGRSPPPGLPPARGARTGTCSCGARRRRRGSGETVSPRSCTPPAAGPGCRWSAPTGCDAPMPVPRCVAAGRWPRSARSSASAAPLPRPCMPRSTVPRSSASPVPGRGHGHERPRTGARGLPEAAPGPRLQARTPRPAAAQPGHPSGVGRGGDRHHAAGARLGNRRGRQARRVGDPAVDRPRLRRLPAEPRPGHRGAASRPAATHPTPGQSLPVYRGRDRRLDERDGDAALPVEQSHLQDRHRPPGDNRHQNRRADHIGPRRPGPRTADPARAQRQVRRHPPAAAAQEHDRRTGRLRRPARRAVPATRHPGVLRLHRRHPARLPERLRDLPAPGANRRPGAPLGALSPAAPRLQAPQGRGNPDRLASPRRRRRGPAPGTVDASRAHHPG